MLSAVAFLYLLVSSLQTFDFVHLQSCELVTIPQCKSMPYNRTRFPNEFKHARQAEAKQFIQQFDVILKRKCSEDLAFYLCAKIAPICLEGQGLPPVPPCKSVCMKVKKDCMTTIKHLNKTWPKGPEHDCSALPEYENGVCITPGAFAVAQPKLPPKAKLPKQAKDIQCEKKCKRRTHMDIRKYKKSKFDCAYRARLIQIVNNSDGNTNFTIKVLRYICNLKHKSAKGNQESVRSQAHCDCVKPVIGKVYLFAGHMDTVNNQMVLGWVEYWKRPLKPLFGKIRKYLNKEAKGQQRKKP